MLQRVYSFVYSTSPIPKKGNAKECSNYCTIRLISHANKVMLKILQERLQQYVNGELPDVQAGFRLTLCDPMDYSTSGFPVLHYSQSLFRLMSIELGMPSNHLILCRPILLPSIFPSIRAFSKEWALWMRWPFSKKLLNGHDSTQTFCPSILYLSYVKYISSLRSFFFLFLALFSSIFNNCKDLS